MNIAVEQYLIQQQRQDTVVLYMWKNRRTVVIGQNQNPYSECNVEMLEADGGYLMRRKTGGGAVFHDDGNINFSFIAPPSLYDLHKHLSVMAEAMADFGIEIEFSGRNDILCNGRKFSGNAFSKGQYQWLHHGTILIRSNMDDLQRYLKAKPSKLQKHGVASYQSRVINLSEVNPTITSENIVPHLLSAFEKVYGETVEVVDFGKVVKDPLVLQLYTLLASDEWKYGRWKTFTSQQSSHFDWGDVDISATVDNSSATYRDVAIASDCLDVEAIHRATQLLEGASIHAKPQTDNPIIEDILTLLY